VSFVKTTKKKKQQIVRNAIFAMVTALLLLVTACSGGATSNPSSSQASTKAAAASVGPTKAAARPVKATIKTVVLSGKQQADKVAAKAAEAQADVAARLTELGYGANKGWTTTMTTADWAKVAMNNPGYMVQGTSFAKTPEEAAAVAVNNTAVAGTSAQKADPSNWKLVYNPQRMIYPSMAYQDQSGNIFWGNDFVEQGVAMWVNVASGGSFRLLCDNANKVAPVATPLPPSLPQVKPNPAVVPPVVHHPKPPVVTPPVVVTYMFVCDTVAKTGATIKVTAEEAKNPRYATPGSPNCQPVVPPKMIEVCVLADNSKITIKETAFDAKLYTHGWEDCVPTPPKMVEACVIGSGNKTLQPISATIYKANPKIYTTDTTLCATPPCGCVPPPVQRCDTGVTPWAYVTISQEAAKDTNRYKDIPEKDCVKPTPPVCDQKDHPKPGEGWTWDQTDCKWCPPVVTCSEGQTPNPNYPTSPDKCLEKKDTDPSKYHTNPGVPPVVADPSPSTPGLDHTTTETDGRGGTVVDTPTNTDPTAPSGVTAPGATAPNKMPPTQVNEGGATDPNGTNSGTVNSNPIDAPTVTPPAAPAPVDNSAAKAAAQATADQAAQDAANVAALQATRAQAQAAADQAAQQAAQTQAAQAAQVTATTAPAAQPAPTSAPAAGTTAVGAPVMAPVTASASNG
jgi:hypothetical protein